MKEKTIEILIEIAIALAFVLLIWQMSFFVNFASKPNFGVTFSAKQAENLGLSWKTVYLDILEELNVKYLRLPIYWDEVEKNEGKYDLADIDWQIREAEKHNVKVILAVGQRVPRWPECHRPDWIATKTQEKQKESLFKYLKVLSQKYKNSPALEMWQVENEPFLNAFGDCPAGDKDLLISEIAQIKLNDPVHPVIITDSGELSSWLRTAKYGDYFGFSVYRSVNSFFGLVTYNHIIPPFFYRAKAWVANKPIDKVFVSELQAEPWSKKDLINTPIKEQEKSFNIAQFKKNIDFSRNLGVSRVYMWGAEWWYWKKTQGDPTFWELARIQFN